MADDNPFEDGFTTLLWAWVTTQFVRPIRRSIIVAVGVLSLVVTLSKILLGIDLREAVLGSYFLTSLALSALVLAIQFLRHARGIQRLLGFPLLLIAAVFAGSGAWEEWQYRYVSGIAMERHWKEVERNLDRRAMILRLRALSSDAASLHLVARINPDKCPSVHIVDLHPTYDTGPGLLLQGAEKVSTPINSEWNIAGFARPASIDLRLTLQNVDDTVSPGECVPLLLGVTRTAESETPKSAEESK